MIEHTYTKQHEALGKALRKMELQSELTRAVEEFFRLKKRHRRYHTYVGEAQLETAWKAYNEG